MYEMRCNDNRIIEDDINNDVVSVRVVSGGCKVRVGGFGTDAPGARKRVRARGFWGARKR